MKVWNRKKIAQSICGGVVATTLCASAWSVRAEQSDLDKTRDKTAASSASADQNDPATCIKEAAKMNAATIRFAQLASQKGENAELKRFAQTIEKDHKKAQTDLESIAKTHNVALSPNAPLDQKCEEELTKLQSYSGQQFDQEFAKGAVEGHAMAIAHLQKGSTQAKDADIRQYTQNQLALVKEHQRRGREVARAVGVDQATITALETKATDSVGAGATTETSTEISPTKDATQPKDSSQYKDSLQPK